MATETECIAALTAMFGATPAGLGTIDESKGYLYQAVVFEGVARNLRARVPHEWTVHNPGGIRTFAYTAGATLPVAIHALSRCSHANGVDHFVQGLTVRGWSEVTHHLDATKVRIVGGEPAWPDIPSGEWVRASFECKNIEDGISLDVSREMLGLHYDVVRPWHPDPHRLALVSAQKVSFQAQVLMLAHGVAFLDEAHPASRNTWCDGLANLIANK